MLRVLTSCLFCVQMLLYMAIVVYAPSLALLQVSHIHVMITYYDNM